MSAAFWFIAGVLAGVTAAAVAIPLWRPSLRVLERTPLRYAIPAGAIATFAVAAAVIYLTIGSPRAVNVSATSVIPMPPELHLDLSRVNLDHVLADRAAIRQINPQRFDMEQRRSGHLGRGPRLGIHRRIATSCHRFPYR